MWGGVYQYSDRLDWKGPHFERIMSVQAQSVRSYALAYRLSHDEKAGLKQTGCSG